MLYSHNQENEKLNLFTIFLRHAAKGDAHYASTVNDVLHETQLFATGQKTVYTVKRDIMYIILLLCNLSNNFFKNLGQPSEFDSNTYNDVLKIISKRTVAPAY